MIARWPPIAVTVLCTLLTVATSASAENGWVLWRETDDFWTANSVKTAVWKILRAYERSADCFADRKTGMAGQESLAAETSSKGLEVRFVDENLTSTYRDGQGKIMRIVHERFLCLPGTLDPRGPKEK